MLADLHKEICTHASASPGQVLIENLWSSSQWKLKFLYIYLNCNGWPEFNLFLNTDGQCPFKLSLYNKQSPELELAEELPAINAKMGCTSACIKQNYLPLGSWASLFILVICRREAHVKLNKPFTFGSCQCRLS